MDERSVVTVFLRNRGQVLLLRRSEAVGSYPGKWGAVAGHADGDPDRAARTEIREETGLDPETVTFRRRGDSFEFGEPDLDIRWEVHPYLFETKSQSIEPNWETAEYEWVHSPAILARETVPELWTSYDRVRPSLSSVTEDRTHGSAALSIRALEVLRDEAAVLADTGGGWSAIAFLAAELRNARMEMAAVRNRIDSVMARADEERTPEAVRDAAIEVIDSAVGADSEAAKRAASQIAGKRVFTLSRSGTVRSAIAAGEPDRVTVAVSRPGGEGAAVAEEIANEEAATVRLVFDATISQAVSESDVVLVGADTIASNGAVINKVGTTAAALAAREYGVAVYAVAATAKISHLDPRIDEEASTAELYDGEAPVEVSNPIFERTPEAFFDAVITEAGSLDRPAVEEIAERFAERASWVEEWADGNGQHGGRPHDG